MIAYAYFGYPFSMMLVGLIHKNKSIKEPYLTDISIIITVHNEENKISKKIENTLNLDYPKEKMQILVASDGSTDQTDEIVKRYRDKGVELISIGERHGKEFAQREAIKYAKGEILVFTDASTILDENGVGQIVSNFSDPNIGCVSSNDKLIGKDGRPTGEGLYVRYEMWVRILEARVNTLVGLSGSFFAARKTVCQDFSPDMQSDFRTLLNSIKQGMRGVIDVDAIGYYQNISDEKREFNRKVRTVIRGLNVFFNHMEFLNITRYGLFSYQFFCHKLLRWLVPVFLCSAFVSNAYLISVSPIYLLFFLMQSVFYGLAAWGWKQGRSCSKIYFKVPFFFLSVNASILVAWWRYLKGDRMVMWTPSER